MHLPAIIREAQERIRSADIESQEVPFVRESWSKHIIAPDDIDLGDIFDGIAGNSITRQDIFDRSPSDADNLVPCNQADVARWVRFFILVMIWGHGTGDRRGPWKTNRMINDPQFLACICKAGEECFNGFFPKAYRTLQAIDRLGPPFASKLLYFNCRNFNASVRPLILDRMVVKTIREFDISTSLIDEISRGMIPKPSPYAYAQYLILMHNWSHAIHCSPDQLEHYLWGRGMGFLP